MKKLLFITLLFSLAFALPSVLGFTDANAQLTVTRTPTTAKDSVVNADTIYVNVTPPANDVAGIHMIGTKATGTTSSTKVYLQGTVDGTNYHHVDSVTLSNSTYLIATFKTPDPLPFVKYRLQVAGAGTQKITGVRGIIIRRTGR